MPHVSERAKLIEELEIRIIWAIGMWEDDTPEFDQLVDEYRHICGHRYYYDRVIAPKTEGLRRLLIEERLHGQFKQVIRVKQETFQIILSKIQNHPIFHNRSTCSQNDVWLQLMVALNRFGTYGNGASIGAVGRLFGISAGTVVLYTNRVCQALVDILPEWISWPDDHERKLISRRFWRGYGLRHAVGIVDGTYVIFHERPGFQGAVWFNRKQRYSMNLQLVIDDRKFIRYFVCGHPGSVYDNSVYSQCSLAVNPGEYFSNKQYLLADCGYALTNTVCTPYKHPLAAEQNNAIFNYHFSAGRVHVEHCNGMLKNRFMSLKDLRVGFHRRRDLKKINVWIKSCLVLHNMCIHAGDEWSDDEDDEDDHDMEIYDDYNFVSYGRNNLRSRVHHALNKWLDT